MKLTSLIDGDVLLNACMWKVEEIGKAKEQFNYHINEILEATANSEYILALGSIEGKNPRDDMHPEYKQTATRTKGRKERPSWYLELKQWIADQPDTVVADNCEADDLLGIWATQLGFMGCYIASVDKDLNQIPGHHYNIRQQRYYTVTEEEANNFLLEQLVHGDPGDNIPGLSGLGPVKTKKLLRERGYKLDTVVELYQDKYGSSWENWLLANGKMVFIHRKDYDWFTLERAKEVLP